MKGLSAYQSFFQDGVGYFALPSAQDVFRLWESIGDFQLPNPKYKEFFATSFAPYFQGTDSFDACYDSFCNRLFYMAMNDGRFFSGSSARQPERKFFVDS